MMKFLVILFLIKYNKIMDSFVYVAVNGEHISFSLFIFTFLYFQIHV